MFNKYMRIPILSRVAFKLHNIIAKLLFIKVRQFNQRHFIKLKLMNLSRLK